MDNDIVYKLALTFSQKELAGMEKMQERENKIIKLEKEIALLKETLELIAAPKRADGTYNRCREACEQLANKALKGG